MVVERWSAPSSRSAIKFWLPTMCGGRSFEALPQTPQIALTTRSTKKQAPRKSLFLQGKVVERKGIEPSTFALRTLYPKRK
jgi:hypothetical protein